MKNLRFLFILGALLSADSIAAQYTLTLNLMDMDAYIGHRIEVRVTEQPSGKEVGRKAIPSLESSSATLVLYVFLQGRNYNVDFFADVNDNGSYDAPPVDHAWRRIIINAGADIQVDFSPDESYFDIEFTDAFQYSQYHAVWGGKWKNNTFGSTDSIMASFQLRCDSVFGSFMTKGVFGNPAPVTFNYAGAVPPDTASSDTIRYTVPAPWSGEVIVVNSDITGNITLAGTGLNFTGTLGEKQILCLYTVVVGGNPFANGYFYVRELNIVSSAPPLELSYLITDPTCAGDCNGYVDLTVTGGTPAYTYAWFNGLASADYPFACAGPGDVTVFDEGGCSATIAFVLIEPVPILTQIETTNPSCAGLCDGVIDITVTGGVGPPYNYEWSGGSGGILCAGEYTITVTDAHGCTDVTTVFLTDPAPIQILNLSITYATSGQNDGSITIIASGGSPPLVYILNDGPPQASNVFNNLPPGEFEVCVEDVSGCLVCETVILQEISRVEDLDHSFSFYPNPVTNEFHIDSDAPLSVEILDLQGRKILREDFKLNHHLNMINVPDGMYVVKISDGEKSAYRKIEKTE